MVRKNNKKAAHVRNGKEDTKREDKDISERVFKNLLDEAPLGISVSRGEKVLYVNKAYRRLYRIPHGFRIVGRSHMIFVAQEDQERVARYNAARMIKGGDAPRSYDTWSVRMDGTRVPIHVSVTPIRFGGSPAELVILEDITERKQAEQRLYHLSRYDTVTGLPNRLLFSETLLQAIAQAALDRRMLAVLFIDLDRFKEVNDSLGHIVGDLILQEIAERLTQLASHPDAVARTGSDEFAFLLPVITRNKDVELKVAEVLAACQRPLAVPSQELHITASIGVSLYPGDGEDPEALMRHADMALLRAKTQGGNIHSFFAPDMGESATVRVALKSKIRKALDAEQFLVYYQPMVSTSTGRMFGVEALVRWNHPEMGVIPPAAFIDMAEETGLILPLGEWIMRSACRQNRTWQITGLPPIKVAVNLSARQFQHRDLVEVIKEILQEIALEPSFLELEITESAAMWDMDRTIQILKKLRGLGICIAIDDFGQGYSSLSCLKRFPVTSVKIDRSFIREVASNPDDAAIVQAIINMAHAFQLEVVGEGVETMGQLDFLISAGCDAVQGFLFGRAAPAADFLKQFSTSLRWNNCSKAPHGAR